MIVGIDLGTTNSAVAIWRDGKAQLIPNSLGEVLTPSAVNLDDEGTLYVGRATRDRQPSAKSKAPVALARTGPCSHTRRLPTAPRVFA